MDFFNRDDDLINALNDFNNIISIFSDFLTYWVNIPKDCPIYSDKLIFHFNYFIWNQFN